MVMKFIKIGSKFIKIESTRQVFIKDFLCASLSPPLLPIHLLLKRIPCQPTIQEPISLLSLKEIGPHSSPSKKNQPCSPSKKSSPSPSCVPSVSLPCSTIEFHVHEASSPPKPSLPCEEPCFMQEPNSKEIVQGSLSFQHSTHSNLP